MSSSALLLIAGVVAVLLLSWLGISMLGSDETPAPAAIESAPQAQAQVPAPVEAPPAVVNEPSPQPTATSTTHEVIPAVSRSSLDTISGTIRVHIRVIVAKDGTVVAATTDIPGPSRYFERLAVEAAKKWTFTPTDAPEQRVMLVKFAFRRSGTTASFSSLR
ncbi:MAG TPA: TonB family protein [Steroidobacter sp.]|nr:TonB family protein [Steroidobacter sp.]